jgi:hypothetical protein
MRRWLRREGLFLVVLALILLISLPILTYPLGRDQGEFATLGRGLLNGRIPYVDLWNPKPPAVFYVYAAAMAVFGQTAPALRAIDLIIAPFILAAVCWLGTRSHSRRVGLWAALLLGVFYFSESFWTLTQNDGISLLPMTLALLCVFKAADGGRRSWLWTLGAGLLCGWVVWFKYPFVLFGGAAVLSYVLLRWETVPRVRWSDVLAFGIGFAVVIGGGIGILMMLGAWNALVESATATSQYTALGFNWTDFSEAMRTALGFRWAQWGLLWLLAAPGIAIALSPIIQKRLVKRAGLNPTPSPSPNSGRGEKRMFALPPPLNSGEGGEGQPEVASASGGGGQSYRSAQLVLLLWLETGILIMLVQAKGYDYHWLPMLPPLALLGGVGIEWILDKTFEPPGRQARQEGKDRVSWRSLRPGGSIMIAFGLFAILAVSIWSRALPYLIGQEDQIAYYHHFQAGEFVADESQLMANFLRERVAPGDSLYIWGFRPEVYYLSRLNPPTRFIFQFPLVADWYPEAWRAENVEILWAALPPYVLILQVDYMPWVTGSHEDSNTLLQSYDELNDWLIYNYERETQIGNFWVWRRKS